MDRTSLMNALIEQALGLKEAARKAQFDAAKTNVGKLMALGVIVTCDDEMESAYRYSHYEEMSRKAGVPHYLYERAAEYAQLADSIVAQLKTVAENGETYEEFRARVDVARRAAISPRFVPEGKKLPCKHLSAGRAHGLMRSDHSDDIAAKRARFVCCRCTAGFHVPLRPVETTDAARDAAETLRILENPGMEGVRDAAFEKEWGHKRIR